MIGVTVVSFGIMQFAPGDPELVSASGQGDRKQTGQTQELYRITRRSLNLDKPLLLNTRYFTDYGEPLRQAAWFLDQSPENITKLLPAWREAPTEESSARLAFIGSLRTRQFQVLVPDLEKRLASPARHRSLAAAMRTAVTSWLDDVGPYGVAAAMELLEDEDLSKNERIGVTQVLSKLMIEPQRASFSTGATPEAVAIERPQVERIWSRWLDLQRDQIQPISDERKGRLEDLLLASAAQPSAGQMDLYLADQFDMLMSLTRADEAYLAEKLLTDDNVRVKIVAATLLSKTAGGVPLRLIASSDSDDQRLTEIVKNWEAVYDVRRNEFEYDVLTRLGGFFVDTQYARMAWKLFTFQFGDAAIKSGGTVNERLLRAFWESAPIMLASQVMIYFVAIPLGLICGVNRGNLIDRGISTSLLFLYSVPPSVAAMLLLIGLCYPAWGIFPTDRLHSPGADNWNWFWYSIDFVWHAFLPVICLSLFSLASMAMYSRGSILEVLSQDYIRTARAKGVKNFFVITKHALRNSLIPILTLFSNFLPALLGGSVIIEVLFGINGLGKLGWESIFEKDFPTQMALLYVSALVVMLSILATDLLYMVADPRIGLDKRD